MLRLQRSRFSIVLVENTITDSPGRCYGVTPCRRVRGGSGARVGGRHQCGQGGCGGRPRLLPPRVQLPGHPHRRPGHQGPPRRAAVVLEHSPLASAAAHTSPSRLCGAGMLERLRRRLCQLATVQSDGDHCGFLTGRRHAGAQSIMGAVMSSSCKHEVDCGDQGSTSAAGHVPV